MAKDYDTPRKADDEVQEDSFEELQSRRQNAGTSSLEDDENEVADAFELPGADLSGEELSVRVLPKQDDEFTCSMCFLVHHISQMSHEENGQPICSDCAFNIKMIREKDGNFNFLKANKDTVNEVSTEQRFEENNKTKSHGPYDITDNYEHIKRLNLGALRIPAIENMQVHLDPSDKEGYFTSVTLVINGSAVNLMALTDTKSGEMWADLSSILTKDTTRKGGTVTKEKTRFGEEITTRTPITAPDGRTAIEIMRFIGIEGPRWIVRAIITGKALHDQNCTKQIEEILEKLVVDRGEQPIPPGEILLLDLPKELEEMLKEK